MPEPPRSSYLIGKSDMAPHSGPAVVTGAFAVPADLRPPSEGRRDKRQNADRPRGSERLLWRSGGSREYGLLRPGRPMPEDAGSRGPLQYLLDQVRKRAQHLRSGGGKLEGAALGRCRGVRGQDCPLLFAVNYSCRFRCTPFPERIMRDNLY